MYTSDKKDREPYWKPQSNPSLTTTRESGEMNLLQFYYSSLLFLLALLSSASASDTLTSSGSLTTSQTLISAGGKFELGFFSGSTSTQLYLGIWYYNLTADKYIVWVANRDDPLRDAHSAVLRLGDRANNNNNIVFLAEGNGTSSTVVWGSGSASSSITVRNPVAQLLDDGNFVIREHGDTNPSNYIWQSFDHPTDTLLPGQKLGLNVKTGLNTNLTSWKTETDPSTGNYTFKMNTSGDPELFLYQGPDPIYRSGPWIGDQFSGVPEMTPDSWLNFTFSDINDDQVYYKFEQAERSTVRSRLVVISTGVLNRYTWISGNEGWDVFWKAPSDQCDGYAECGVYGVCDSSALFVCQCLPGFIPRDQRAWELRDGSDGCKRTTPLGCTTTTSGSGGDGFRVMTNMKLPESGGAVVDRTVGIDECRKRCLSNCSCTAYASAVVVNGGAGSGCVMFTGDLVDLRNYGEGGQNLYFRLAAADLASDGGSNKTKTVIIAICVSLGATILLVGLAGWFRWKRKKTNSGGKAKLRVSRPGLERSQDFLLSGNIISGKREAENGTEDTELPPYDFETLAVATENFSEENKLGQGGFGHVYKGVLGGGVEVAVKRLSRKSGQGVEEFKNEVKLIAKLQHRNLVRLLGCCGERQEKMLIYEYMPNRSLDSILFHNERCQLLDWQKRFNIICGIARGLVYLHQDSLFRIIHRDLKASNILLDSAMNPKISDFGMARIFGGDETEANSTRRVVGTYGYMAPEYAMDGIFSVKSDVFSFGVLVLEIITGKKNKGFFNSNHELNLLGYAWKLWKEGKGTELLCPSIGETYSPAEVLRCIQVGLLCVQERADDRPTMPSVVLLLSSESASLPQPKLPGFCLGWNPNDTSTSSGRREDESFTVNQVTVTMMDGR